MAIAEGSPVFPETSESESDKKSEKDKAKKKKSGRLVLISADKEHFEKPYEKVLQNSTVEADVKTSKAETPNENLEKETKEKKAETTGQLTESRSVKTEASDSPQTEKSDELPAEQRRRAQEAHQLHGSQQAPEHIGHMLMAAEARSTFETEKAKTEAGSEKKTETTSKQVEGKKIETLNRADLLKLSETINVEGSSLRQIYETHLVGERGLRRLVIEHLRGGDLKRALRQEIVEREIDFERDPALRDMAVAMPTTGSYGGKTELNKLLEQANVKLSDTSEEAAFFKARAVYEAQQYQAHQKYRKLTDSALVTVIVILIGLLVFLVMTRI